MIRFRQIAAPAIVSAAMLVSLQGCASADRPDSVPAHASMVSEGRETVAAGAPHDGMVYVTDSTDNKLIYSGKVNQGDNVQVDTKKNRILLNDRVAMDSGLSDSDHYKIYFQRSQQPDAEMSAHHETVIQPAPAPTYNNNYNGTSPADRTNSATPNGSTAQPDSNGATITQPNGTVVKPNGTVVQPDGTVVKPGDNGNTTVVTPSR